MFTIGVVVSGGVQRLVLVGVVEVDVAVHRRGGVLHDRGGVCVVAAAAWGHHVLLRGCRHQHLIIRVGGVAVQVARVDVHVQIIIDVVLHIAAVVVVVHFARAIAAVHAAVGAHREVIIVIVISVIVISVIVISVIVGAAHDAVALDCPAAPI